MRAMPNRSPWTIWPPRRACRALTSAGCSPARSASRRALPADPAVGAGGGAAASHRPVGGRHLRDGRIAELGSFTTSFARVYGLPPAAYRASLPPASVHARVPSCILQRDTRPPADSRVKTAHGEKTIPTAHRSVVPMIKIASAHLWVHDQEVALQYWTEKVGLEVREDVSMPELQFPLADGRPAGPGRHIDRAYGRARPAGHGRGHQKQVLDLTAKGFAGTVFLTTDDCQAATRS